MGSVFSAFLHTINVPAEEINDLTDHITRRQFNMMFDSFEAYDVQETRRVSREEGRIEGERAGRIEGEQLYLIKQIIKRIIKNSKMVKNTMLLFSETWCFSLVYSYNLYLILHNI